jgi:protein involved in polysaccharide export with SLBB domain
MNKLKLFLLSFAFISISGLGFSQAINLSELDDEFLRGLSPSVKDQVETQNKLDQQSQLEKLFRSETSVEKNRVILDRLKDEIAALDIKLNSILDNDLTALPRFGDSFFRSLQSSFMPINVPNMTSDYIVDVGDVFEVLLTGKVESNSNPMVLRDGNITIGSIGKVSVVGKTLQEVEKIVKQYVTTRMIGVDVYISLATLRDVQVLILGQIDSPGIYTLSGGSAVLSAIDVAGGIGKTGSFRKIEHRRNGELLESIDLYKLLVFGEYRVNNTIRSGDTIYVFPSAFQVPVTGGVTNSASFELLPGETALDAINYASGFSEYFSGFNSIFVNRVQVNKSSIIEVPVSGLEDFKMQPRDSILVPSYKNEVKSVKYVTVTGEVNRPGDYVINDGDKLSDIIERSGGYKEEAYIYGSALFRENAADQEKLFAQLNYSDTINYIISNIGKSNAGIGGSVLNLLAEEVRARYIEGRVVTDFQISNFKQNPSLDIELMDKDRLHIPKLQKVVYLFGDFKKPSNYFYDPSLSANDYIKMAGGLKESAYNELLLIDPDGKTHTIRNEFFFNSQQQIYPGSIIYAQRDIGKLSGISYASALAPILSGLAISLASLNSITND